MNDDATPPILIDAVECSPGGYEKVIVRVTGKWQGGRKRGADARPVLIVQKDGRRHQFRAMPETRRPRIPRPGAWASSFVLPMWLEPRLGGQMSLWVGEIEIPLPTGAPLLESTAVDGLSPTEQPHDAPAQVQPAPAPPRKPPAEPRHTPAPPQPVSAPPPSAPAASRSAPPQSAPAPPKAMPAQPQALRRTQLPPPQRQAGPRESRRPQIPPAAARAAGDESELEATVAALRAELQERAAAEARDRTSLADARAELKARSSRQTRLEAALAELRAELQQLHELVEEDRSLRTEYVAELTASLDQVAAERDELTTHVSALRGELAGAKVACEAAESEALGWRAEVERLGGELAASRDEQSGTDGGLGEAEELLAQARALRTRIQRQGVSAAAPAADGS